MKLPSVLILPAPDVSLVLDLCVSRQSELWWRFLPLPCVALRSRRPREPALGLPPSVWYSASQAAKFCKSLPAGDSCTAGRHHLWWPFRAGRVSQDAQNECSSPSLKMSMWQREGSRRAKVTGNRNSSLYLQQTIV